MTYKIEFEQNELGLIARALSANPFAEVAPLMQRIGQQVQLQDEERKIAEEASAVTVDWGARWEHAARTMLQPEEYERLAARIGAESKQESVTV